MSVQSRTALIAQFKKDVIDALNPLMHSWEKLRDQNLPSVSGSEKNLDELEPWEALTSRFARVTNIFLSKYIRVKILDLDPGFRGEMRDLLDKAEKVGFISSADQWMKIRELRTLEDILVLTPFVLDELKEFNF